MNPCVAVVDHGAGNLVSIRQALVRAGAQVTIATSPEHISGVDLVVLPGVGATKTVMDGIDAAGLRETLQTLTVPLFGICVGMQVLFEFSEEDDVECLGLISGSVQRLTNAPTMPHIGWNDLTVRRPDPMFSSINDDPVYFVHSFAPIPDDPAVVVATSAHGDPFTAAVRYRSVAGTQFHPERSGDVGLAILMNVVSATASVSA